MPRIPNQPDWPALTRLAWEGWALWMEASNVIWLRTLRLSQGGAVADREATRMITEKLTSNWELGWMLMTGGTVKPETAARRSVRHYRKSVRANQRRLG